MSSVKIFFFTWSAVTSFTHSLVLIILHWSNAGELVDVESEEDEPEEVESEVPDEDELEELLEDALDSVRGDLVSLRGELVSL